MTKVKKDVSHVEILNDAGETVRVYGPKQGKDFAEKAEAFAKKNGLHIK